MSSKPLTPEDEKLHQIVSNYFLSDAKANRSIKEADDMASDFIKQRDQQKELEWRESNQCNVH